MFVGRKDPYTIDGLKKKPCSRCGEPSRYQWNACANGNRWVPLCVECDILLNGLVLKFFRFANRRRLMTDYKERVKNEVPRVVAGAPYTKDPRGSTAH